jgi:hypothetical protein
MPNAVRRSTCTRLLPHQLRNWMFKLGHINSSMQFPETVLSIGIQRPICDSPLMVLKVRRNRMRLSLGFHVHKLEGSMLPPSNWLHRGQKLLDFLSNLSSQRASVERRTRVVIARFPAPRLWLILMISVATFRLLPRRRDGMRLDLRHYLLRIFTGWENEVRNSS